MKAVQATVTRGLPIGARLICADNTGAKIMQIITVLNLGGVHRRLLSAGVGDMVMASVKKGTPELRKTIVNAVVIRQRRPYRRPDGTMVSFEDNAAVLVADTGETKGSDIKGPVAREAAERWSKIAATAAIII
ncbi:MAG: 50S ribosomal protein L14 [Thermoplasmata archaeon]